MVQPIKPTAPANLKDKQDSFYNIKSRKYATRWVVEITYLSITPVSNLVSIWAAMTEYIKEAQIKYNLLVVYIKWESFLVRL